MRVLPTLPTEFASLLELVYFAPDNGFVLENSMDSLPYASCRYTDFSSSSKLAESIPFRRTLLFELLIIEPDSPKDSSIMYTFCELFVILEDDSMGFALCFVIIESKGSGLSAGA